MTGFVINVDHWPNSKFVTVSGYRKHMRPDTFFCQYAVGKMKPNYPMPAVRYTVEIQDDRVILWTKLMTWTYRYLAFKPGSRF